MFLWEGGNDAAGVRFEELGDEPDKVGVAPDYRGGLEGEVGVGLEDGGVYFVGGEFVHSFGLLLGGCYLRGGRKRSERWEGGGVDGGGRTRDVAVRNLVQNGENVAKQLQDHHPSSLRQ